VTAQGTMYLMGCRSPMGKGNFCCEQCKMAELIDSPFGLLTQVGRMKHKFERIRQVAPVCLSSDVFAIV